MNPTLSSKVYMGNGLLGKLPKLLKEKVPAYRYALITDSTVKDLYGDALLQTLKKAGLKVELFSFPAGEASKNEATKQRLDHALLKKNYGRDTVILALGGGVVGDMAGFVAATYLRGIPYVQIPTTVLSMVDSSIGGKVGVDTPFGKNMIGAFWHPTLIVADLDTLKTLPKKEVVNGWFEALKMFITLDEATYLKAKKGINFPLLKRAMQLKIQVTEKDERESGLRCILNFGHSIGHALEKLSHYSLPHGFAVALGMLVEARVSVELGYLKDADWKDFSAVLKKLGVNPKDLKSYDSKAVWEALQNDKKNRNGEINFVLLKSLNITHPVSKEVFQKAYLAVTD
ncbi:MAG: 3-dehydroquinate synthase [Candidatus Gracilibacteria bacterium]